MIETSVHYADTEACDRALQVFFDGELVFESSRAIRLNEYYEGDAMSPVFYFPESDLSGLETTPSDLITHCPIKGDASYLNYRGSANCIWSYRDPYPEVGAIKCYYAFDQGKGFRVSAK